MTPLGVSIIGLAVIVWLGMIYFVLCRIHDTLFQIALEVKRRNEVDLNK